VTATSDIWSAAQSSAWKSPAPCEEVGDEGIEVKQQGGRRSRGGSCTGAQPEAARGGGSNAGPALSFAEVAGSDHRIGHSFGLWFFTPWTQTLNPPQIKLN